MGPPGPSVWWAARSHICVHKLNLAWYGAVADDLSPRNSPDCSTSTTRRWPSRSTSRSRLSRSRSRPAPEPAGCCFWASRPSSDRLHTTAADHAHCSVGSYTHGLISLAEAAAGEDTAALVGSGWVTEADLAGAPSVAAAPAAITYEPLDEAEDADVVLVRLTASSLMSLQGACPELSRRHQAAVPDRPARARGEDRGQPRLRRQPRPHRPAGGRAHVRAAGARARRHRRPSRAVTRRRCGGQRLRRRRHPRELHAGVRRALRSYIQRSNSAC